MSLRRDYEKSPYSFQAADISFSRSPLKAEDGTAERS